MPEFETRMIAGRVVAVTSLPEDKVHVMPDEDNQWALAVFDVGMSFDVPHSIVHVTPIADAVDHVVSESAENSCPCGVQVHPGNTLCPGYGPDHPPHVTAEIRAVMHCALDNRAPSARMTTS